STRHGTRDDAAGSTNAHTAVRPPLPRLFDHACAACCSCSEEPLLPVYSVQAFSAVHPRHLVGDLFIPLDSIAFRAVVKVGIDYRAVEAGFIDKDVCSA